MTRGVRTTEGHVMEGKTKRFEGRVYTYSHTANGMHYWHDKVTGMVWVTKAK